MKAILFACASFLFIGIFDLPIGYYTILRIVVTIGSVVFIIDEYQTTQNIDIWIILISFTALLFNPISPIYFNDKTIWVPIDIVCGLIFIIKALSIKK